MRSETISQLAQALSKAQGEFPEIPKSSTVNAGKYSYDYAPLDVVLKTTRQALTKNELALVQRVDEGDDGALLEVTLLHSSGEFITSCKTLGRIPDVKVFGSTMTYYRRYLIEGLLGVASEKDDDGNRADSQPKPQAKATNGNGHKARKPGDFMVWINRQIKDETNQYKHLKHLFNAVREVSTLGDFEWPKANDDDGWRKCAEWGKELIAAKNADDAEQPALIESEGKGKDHYDD